MKMTHLCDPRSSILDPRSSILLAVVAWLAPGWGVAWPDEKAPKLTAQEVMVRLERAGKDPSLLLEIAALAEDKEARHIRQQVKELLRMRKRLATPEELDQLARRLTSILPRAARTPEEVKEVLGPPQQTARQILYRRYLEQMLYDDPLPLCVVFDCVQGQDPRLLNVLVAPTGKP
ncbi:MAG TPA: hypothetical protein VEL76_42510 [Gemmataceae bacterium]|nr:hypothetical protein [Gemmataceae bacterium]